MFEKFPVPFTKLKRLLVESFVNWPLLPTGDPTNSRHPATKAYVDEQGGYILISTQTASNSSTIVFTGLDETYDEYEFRLYNIKPATDLAFLWLRVSEDNGSNYKSGASDYSYATLGYTEAAAASNSNSAGAAQLVVGCSAGIGNSTNEDLTAVVRMKAPSATSGYKKFQWEIAYLNGSTAFIAGDGGGQYKGSTNAINAIQFLMSTGNIASGTFKLYGVKK